MSKVKRQSRREAIDLEGEMWKPLDLEGYHVSNMGRVKSTKGSTAYLVRPFLNSSNTAAVRLRDSKGPRVKTLKALVATAFVGPPPREGLMLELIDGDQMNCAVSNLQWSDQSTIIKRTYERGMHKKVKTWTPPMPENVRRLIRRLWQEGEFSQMQLSRMFRYTNASISRLVKGFKRGEGKQGES